MRAKLWLDRRKRRSITFKVDDVEFQMVKDIAEALEVPMGEAVRRALWAFCTTPEEIIPGDYVPISDVKTGKYVLGLSGLTKVERVISRPYSGEMLRIKPLGLLPFKVTSEHPILVVEGKVKNERVHFSNPIWKRACEVKKKHKYESGDYVVIPRINSEGFMECKKVDLTPFTNQRGLRVAESKGIQLELPLSNELSWLLGLYVAEGYVTGKHVCFYFGKHELELIKKAKDAIRQIGLSPYEVVLSAEVQVGFVSHLFARALPIWCGRGAKNKRIPQFILYNKDVGVAEAFLDGYVRGDGTKYMEKGRYGRWTAGTASKVLALQLQWLAFRLGNIAWIQERKREERKIRGRKIHEGSIFMVTSTLSAPKRSAMRVMSNHILAPVDKIDRFHYRGKVFNLQTADRTYLLSHATVHNCVLYDDNLKVRDALRESFDPDAPLAHALKPIPELMHILGIEIKLWRKQQLSR